MAARLEGWRDTRAGMLGLKPAVAHPGLRGCGTGAPQARGWAVDRGYFTRGVQTVAAPVFDRAGEVTFTIVGVMLSEQYEDAALGEIGEALRDVSHRLTRALT